MAGKLKHLCVILFAVVFLNSCSVQPKDTMEVKTIRYELDSDNFYQFYCNDKTYYGWGFWRYWNGTNMNQDGTIVEVRAAKVSGCEYYGFGAVFGLTNIDGSDNFYRALITVDGWCTMQIVTNNAWAPLLDWFSTSAIVQGYNQVNTIKVSNNYSAGRYCLYINDVYVGYTTKTNLTGGCECGFFTGIGNEADENFPAVPVDCRFKMLFGFN